MDKDKLNSFQFTSFIPMACSSAILGSGYLFLYNKANKSSVIAMLIGFVISIIFNAIIIKLFNTMPEKTLPQKIKALMPKWLYYIICTFLSLVLLMICSLILYRLLAFFSTQFLTDLPQIVLYLVLILLPFYASTKNVEVLSRFSSIAIIICVFSFIFNFVTLYSQVEFNNVLPLIDASVKNIFIAAGAFAIIFSGPSFLLLSVPKNNISDPQNLKKFIILNYILTGSMMFLVNIWTLGALGIDVIKLFFYPAYIVLKKIQIYELVNSIENITILIWFFFLIITSSLALLFSKNIFCELFNIKNKKGQNIFSIVASAVAVVTPLILFSNNTIIEKPEFIIYPIAFYGFLILFALILLILNKIIKKDTTP